MLGTGLDSVCNQTIKDIEIICINDCSLDDSREVVLDYAGKDSRITLYDNEKNIGLASTRNRGIDIAKGEYIYFLDSDDMIAQNALEELYLTAEKDVLDAEVFEAHFIYEDEALKPSLSG
jgi:Glycosyltransferases involved in cell wall biogenesis